MKLRPIADALLLEPAEPVRAGMNVEALDELAASIRAVGLLQPLVVEPRDEKFEVVAGHRRLLACRQVGLDPILCLVREAGDSTDLVATRLHENLLREDLSAIEEAAVYAELFDQVGDTEKVASLVKRSRKTVEDRLALLAGDRQIVEAVHQGGISATVGGMLNRVKDQGMRRYLLGFAVREGATVAKVRQWIQVYGDQELDVGAVPDVHSIEAPGLIAPVEVTTCWLCGSDCNQWEMRVRMVHESCERLARRSAVERIQSGGPLADDE